jgi:hypothetical protein
MGTWNRGIDTGGFAGGLMKIKSDREGADRRAEILKQKLANKGSADSQRISNSGALARTKLTESGAMQRENLVESGRNSRNSSDQQATTVQDARKHVYDMDRLDADKGYAAEESRVKGIDERSKAAYQKAKDLVSMTPKTKLDDRETIIAPGKKSIFGTKPDEEIRNPGYGINEVRNSAYDDAYNNFIKTYHSGDEVTQGPDGTFTNQQGQPDFSRSVVAPRVRESLASRQAFIPDVNGVYGNEQAQVAAPQQRSVAPRQYQQGGGMVQNANGVWENPTVSAPRQAPQPQAQPQHQAQLNFGSNFSTEYTAPDDPNSYPANNPVRHVSNEAAAAKAPANPSSYVSDILASTKAPQQAPVPQGPPAIPPGVAARRGLAPNDRTPIYNSGAQNAADGFVAQSARAVKGSLVDPLLAPFGSAVNQTNNIRQKVLSRLRGDFQRNRNIVGK